MEKLKSTIPQTLQRRIAESTRDDLSSTCSSLLDFFLEQPIFQKVVGDLSDPEMGLCRKNTEAAMEAKSKGNDFFATGNFSAALSSYSQALRVAPAGKNDAAKSLLAMLYVNRAFVLHKLDFLMECLRDCNRALSVSPGYTKGWYRRGKVYASLKRYEDAIHDLRVAMNMEPSSSKKKQIESELQGIQEKQEKQNESSSSLDEPIENISLQSSVTDKRQEIELQILSTPTEGRFMATPTDIPSGFLVHTEEPYAAVISKLYRDSHCHFCFNELPADMVHCPSCSIPLYCSHHCQEQAGGKKMQNKTKTVDVCETSSHDDLESCIEDTSLSDGSSCDAKLFAEHGHECLGANWAAVLPSEIVLAGRILVKSLEQKKHSSNVSDLFGVLDLSHHYEALCAERKQELHVYSIILMYCLKRYCGFEFLKIGNVVSKLVLMLSQIAVNSMAVIRMKSIDVYGSVNQSRKYSGDYLTSNVEQVVVAQAIYLSGSLFNHSCKPNIHAYFASRTLYIRATESVAAGCRLELSYGPQVGQWTCKRRKEFLKDKYSFECHCRGCLELNLSDLVLNAFRCVRPKCLGAVLDSCGAEYEKLKYDSFIGISPNRSSVSHLKVDKQKTNDIVDVASCVFEQTRFDNQVKPGYCLKCGSYRDVETSQAIVNEADISLERLRDAIVAAEVESTCLSEALKCLRLLRSTLHAYNKKIAEVEDNLAQGFCLVGELQPAVEHCRASIEILEKLYGDNHIAIANELIKLVSIQLSVRDCSAVDSLNRANSIFSRYYGSNTKMIYPHLQDLFKEAHKLVR